MPRLLVASCFACLFLIGACVDTSQPTCIKNHSCSGQAGTSGSGGTTGIQATGGQGGSAGVGGGTAGSGGGTAGVGGGVAGSGGGTAGVDGGVAGAGGGGSSGSRDAGTSSDTVMDAPYLGPETEFPSDTNLREPDAQEDVVVDAPIPSVETGRPESGPEPGPDASPDIAPDRAPDLTPDTSPPRPDAGNCIQKFRANGYSLGTDASTAACSGCKENEISREAPCKAMIDCLALGWPSCARGSTCWTTCQNNSNSNSVVEFCVSTLTSAACASH